MKVEVAIKCLFKRELGYVVFKCPFELKPLNDSMNIAFVAQRAICSCIKKHRQQVQGGDSSPLVTSHESSPEVLHPALESSMQERCGFVGLGPEDGRKNDQREKRLQELRLFSLEKRKLWGSHTVAFQYLWWNSKKRCRETFYQGL